jgi:hypothetical protein
MILACLIFSIPLQSNANTITFQNVPTSTIFNNGTFSSGGFNFSVATNVAYVTGVQYCSPLCPVNGSQFFLAPYAATLTMSQTGGGTFGLTGFDGAGAFNFNVPGWGSQFIPTQINVIGQLSGGGSVSQSFLIDKTTNPAGTLNFTSYLFNSAFTNLTSVAFSSSGSTNPTFNGFSVDNIITGGNAVPAPATSALLLTGLGLIGFTRRRKTL